jgi:hypothetical protein
VFTPAKAISPPLLRPAHATTKAVAAPGVFGRYRNAYLRKILTIVEASS